MAILLVLVVVVCVIEIRAAQIKHGMTENEVIEILGKPISRTEASTMHGLFFYIRKERWLLYFKYERGPGPYYPENAYEWRLVDFMISK
jgi:hypothetical protein